MKLIPSYIINYHVRLLMCINISVPTAVTHTVAEPIKFRGYYLAKDTSILANLYQSHTDPAIWEDPFAFNPDRWLDENNKLKNNPAFMPFSVGRCIRLRLFDPVMKTTLTTILTYVLVTVTVTRYGNAVMLFLIYH